MAEQRLPIVDGDDGEWGDVLNQYIEKEHYNTGSNNSANGGHQKVTIRPGTTAAGTAPLKFASGSLMSSPEAGAVEFLTDRLYFTQTTGATRKTIAAFDDSSGATGDIYYRDSNGNFVRLGIGSGTNVLKVSGGVPVWTSLTASDLPTMTATVGGAVPTPPNDVGQILRGNGTWGTLAGSGLTQQQVMAISSMRI